MNSPIEPESSLLSADRPETRLATRLAFLVAGFGVACWAPLVPFAKQRLQPTTARWDCCCSASAWARCRDASGRRHQRPVRRRPIVLARVPACCAVAFVAVPDRRSAGLTLLGFGGALGSIVSRSNVHAVEVERAAAKPLMSGFHALFSVGGFIGATLITFLCRRISLRFRARCLRPCMAIAMAFAAPRCRAAPVSSMGRR